MNVSEIARKVKTAAPKINNASFEARDKALALMADALRRSRDIILKANDEDMKAAKEKGMSDALLDRLKLTSERIDAMAAGIEDVRKLPDCLGEIINAEKRPNGLLIGQMRVPLGVAAIIYEARPNVTADAAALCVKTGNAVILKGGSDAIKSNSAIMNSLRSAVSQVLPEDVLTLIESTDRESTLELMKQNKYIDVLIPRGGAGLIRNVVENATVPVIETGTGNCHIYVHKAADIDMAVNILVNAKTQRIGVCNAAESLVVDEAVAPLFLPAAKEALDKKNVIIYGCGKTLRYIDVMKASEEDFGKEYLDLKISCFVSKNLNEAIEHINRYSTGHSEAIITNDYFASQEFLQRIDSAAVYVNASTRFTDGGEFGFGAEIGISTQKLHARGPMGLKALTSTKYIIYGNGQIR